VQKLLIARELLEDSLQKSAEEYESKGFSFALFVEKSGG
jgi:hypothetical protein